MVNSGVRYDWIGISQTAEKLWKEVDIEVRYRSRARVKARTGEFISEIGER